MAKRLLCVLLSVLMVVAMLPTGVFAFDTVVTSQEVADEKGTVISTMTITESGSLSSLFSASDVDVTDENQYLVVYYSLDDSSYSGWGAGALYDSSGANVGGISVNSYGVYSISLPELEETCSGNSTSVTGGIYLSWWGTSYSTLIKAEIVDLSYTVVASQEMSSSGTLTILSGLDFTDSDLYLRVYYSLTDSDGQWNGPAALSSSSWAGVVSVPSYSSCGGTYSISLVELDSAFTTAGYSVEDGVVLNWWGDSYATLLGAEVIDYSPDEDEDDGETETETVIAAQTNTGTLTILSGADFTDEELYLYVYYTLDNEDYSYYGPAALCNTSWANIVYIDSYHDCSGIYVISLVDLAVAFTNAGDDATSGVILNFWASAESQGAYATFTSAQLVRISSGASGEDEPGETTDYTFPIEGYAYGDGSSAYDTETGTVTFENAWSSCIGWYFGSSSTVKLESLTITFAEAVPNYMQLQVQYCDSEHDNSSVGISTGATSVAISAGEYSSDNEGVIDAGESILQIYLQSGTAESSVTIASVTYTLATETLPTFYGRALTLDGEIGVTYYFSMDGVTNPGDYYLSATIDGGTEQTYTLDSTVDIDDVTYYRYTVYVNPTELYSDIEATLTDGTTEVETTTYSVSTYCEKAIKNEDGTWSNEVALCEAVLNYGYYVETWLNKSSSIDISESDDDWTDPVGTWTVDLSSYSNSTNEEGVNGKTLALDGEGIFIRIYVSDGTANYAVSGQEVITGTDEDNGAYIEFKVAAKNMDKTFTIIKDGEEFSTYSVYSYIYSITSSKIDESNGITENLQNLCKAIYYYCVEAQSYNGWV